MSTFTEVDISEVLATLNAADVDAWTARPGQPAEGLYQITAVSKLQRGQYGVSLNITVKFDGGFSKYQTINVPTADLVAAPGKTLNDALENASGMFYQFFVATSPFSSPAKNAEALAGLRQNKKAVWKATLEKLLNPSGVKAKVYFIPAEEIKNAEVTFLSAEDAEKITKGELKIEPRKPRAAASAAAADATPEADADVAWEDDAPPPAAKTAKAAKSVPVKAAGSEAKPPAAAKPPPAKAASVKAAPVEDEAQAEDDDIAFADE